MSDRTLPTPSRILLLAFVMLAAGCGEDRITGAADAPLMAKGGRPGGGVSEVIPIDMKLANLKQLLCSGIRPEAISAGAPYRVVGWGNCGGGARIFTWNAADGPSLFGGGTVEGMAHDVADDGTIVGHYRGAGGFRPMVLLSGSSALVALSPLPGDGPLGDAGAVSDNGAYVVGAMSAGGVLWTRAGDGSYGIPELIGAVDPTTVSNDGRLVVGNQGGHAFVWRKDGSWNGTPLDENVEGESVSQSSAEAINPAGDVIAGTRTLSPAGDPGSEYTEPVVWILQGTEWTLTPLRGFTFSEGAAYDVADYRGRTTVVGYAWEEASGSGGIMWPVAWTWDRAPGNAFGAPQRLAPLSTKWGAAATAINRDGRIVGEAWTGSMHYANYPVMWRLP